MGANRSQTFSILHAIAALVTAFVVSGCVSSSNDTTFGLAPGTDIAGVQGESFAGKSSLADFRTEEAGTSGSTAAAFSPEAGNNAASTDAAIPLPLEARPATAAAASADSITPAATSDKGPAEPVQTAADNTGNETEVASAPVQAFASPTRKTGRLARLFSFGKPRPPAAIIDLESSGQTSLERGAVTNNAASVTQQPANDAKLPGVRLGSLFGIKRRGDQQAREIQVASAAGLARLVPNGLRAQHDGVETACLKPDLVRLLANVRNHYGREVVITSGYRSTKRQRRMGGVRGSRHTTCEAADIQVPGISKWELAKYLRTVPGRGGVGTYCHTKSVHIDIGSKRDWNWRCKRR